MLIRYYTFFISLKSKILPDFTLSIGKRNYTQCHFSIVYKTWTLHMHVHSYIDNFNRDMDVYINIIDKSIISHITI